MLIPRSDACGGREWLANSSEGIAKTSSLGLAKCGAPSSDQAARLPEALCPETPPDRRSGRRSGRPEDCAHGEPPEEPRDGGHRCPSPIMSPVLASPSIA